MLSRVMSAGLVVLAIAAFIAGVDVSSYDRVFRLAPDDYARARTKEAHGDLPMDLAAREVDRVLPPEAPVRLGGLLASDEFLVQRMSESLYPRRIDVAASHTLLLARDGEGRPLAGPFRLDGRIVEREQPASPRMRLERGIGRALLCLAALLGLGAGVAMAARRFGIELGAGARFLTGLLIVGWGFMVASWFRVRLPVEAVALAGVLGAIVWQVRAGTDSLERTRAALRRPELWLFLFLAFAGARYVFETPIALWDARSIWFFRAKQLAFAGRLTPADAVAYPWAHPRYPQLVPGVLAFFSSFGTWDERRATAGLSVAFFGLLAVFGGLAVRRFGRLPGVALALVVWSSLHALSLGGYADGFVSLFLLIAALAFIDPSAPGLGWLAVWGAAATKREGLALGLALLAGCVLTMPRLRSRRSLVALVGFVPPLLHGFWVDWLGVPDPYSGAIPWSDVGTRLAAIAASVPGYVSWGSPAMSGLIGLALVGVGVARRRSRSSALACLFAAGAALAFVFAAFAATPFDFEWHRSRALGRLLIHPSLLFLLAGALASVPGQNEQERLPERQAQPPVDPLVDGAQHGV